MTIIKDQYQILYGHRDINYAGVTTGKEINHHGIRGREQATGLGVYYATRQILSNQQQLAKLGLTEGIKGKRFIVQGYGNVGYWASKFFTEDGGILVGVAEADGSFVCPDGIDPDDLLAFKKQKRGIKGYLNAKSLVGTEYVHDDAIFHEWYQFHNLVISSSLQPTNRLLTGTMLINSSANLSLKPPMVPPLELLRKFFQPKESVSFLMSSATQVV